MSAATKQETAHGPSSIHPTAFVHPLAFVDNATIGARTKVWQFASVIRGAVLGEECSVASGVTIDGARFGDGCVISQGVTTAPGLVCHDDVFLGPNVSVCNDRWPTAEKSGFDIDQYLARPCVVIHDGASVGAGAVLLPGIQIGLLSMIAAGSVVSRDVPKLSLWKRDGEIVPIVAAKCFPRMRFCK